MMKRITLIIISCLLSIMLSANWKMDAYALKCHTADGAGDFSLQSITINILGVIDAGGAFPDLLVENDSWYPGCRYYKYVRHNDSGVPVFRFDGEICMPKLTGVGGTTTCVVQDGGKTELFWYTIDTLHVASFDVETRTFDAPVDVPFCQMKYKPKAMFVEKTGKYGYRVWYGAQDRWAKKVPGNNRKGEYFPYDGAGVWRGGFAYMGLYCVDLDENFSPVNEPVMVSATEREVLQTYCTLDAVSIKDEKGIIAGSYLGGLYYYARKNKGVGLGERKYIVDKSGIAHRHPGVVAAPVSYPSRDQNGSDIVASCEGGIYFYRSTGRLTEDGSPVFESPVPLQEENPLLFGGSLTVPTVVDWDGDGVLDIVSGNSQGHILFFKNIGCNESPEFTTPVFLKSCGHVIHVQPGYGEDIQGPLEARWGYVCPNVFDWNGDGKLDIIFGDSRGKNIILLGKDGPVDDRLDIEHPIYCYDLDLHGTWRCRPGLANVGSETQYITLDDDNELHLYSRIDTYNVRDCGKLCLKGGGTIKASVAESGGTGRLKIEIVDWDGDGKNDLLLGTCAHHSVPGVNGLPEKFYKKDFRTVREALDTFKPYGKSDVVLLGPVYKDASPESNVGSTVLFLKNVGKNDKPVYDSPEALRFEGERIKLGQHSIGVCAAMLGRIDGGMPNLLVSDERGRFYLLDRENLTW